MIPKNIGEAICEAIVVAVIAVMLIAGMACLLVVA